MKYLTKTIYRRKSLFGLMIPEGEYIMVWEAWQQEARGGNGEIQLQTHSRECELE